MNEFLNLYAAPVELASHAATLMTIAPLIGACIAFLSAGRRFAGVSVIGAASISLWMAVCLSGEVARRGAVDEDLGGLASGIGIVAHVDALGALFALSLSAVGLAAAIFFGANANGDIADETERFSPAAFLLCLGGVYGLTLTANVVAAYAFLELAALAAHWKLGVRKMSPHRSPASFAFLVANGAGSALFVLGVAFLFGATGALDMSDLAQRLATLGGARIVQAALALIVVGLALKAGVFPFTGWLVDIDVEASPSGRLVRSSLMTTAALYLLVRFLATVFGLTLGPVDRVLIWVIGPLSAFGAVAAAWRALRADDFRRFAASSSSAEISLVILCIATGGRPGLAAGLVLLLAQMLSKAALTFAMNLVGDGADLQRGALAGAASRSPGLIATVAATAFMLVGGPLTLGFWAKWRLVESSLVVGRGWAVAVIAVVSLILLIALGRWLEAFFIVHPAEPRRESNRAGESRGLSRWAPLGVLTAFSLWLGLDASLPVSFADVAAKVASAGR